MGVALLWAVLAMGFCSDASADVLTWIGGSSGVITDPANWTNQEGTSASPQPGDVLNIGSAITLTGSFDLTGEGLAISKSADVVNQVTFSGTGKLTLTGLGKWSSSVVCSHSGGTEIRDGNLSFGTGSWGSCLGSGTVDLYANANAGSPMIQIGAGSGTLLAAPVSIHGKLTGGNGAINIANPTRFGGVISSDADFKINVGWGKGEFQDDLAASGHTVYLSNASNRELVFQKAVNAKVSKSGAGLVTFSGTTTDSASTIAASDGTIAFSENASWAGSSIAMSGSSVLQFGGDANLPSASTIVTLTGTAKIRVQSPCVRIASLVVGDVSIESGVYDAHTLPEAIESGTVLVGESAFWVGGPEGAWSDAENWSTRIVPTDGAAAIFTNDVTLANETFDFGAGGIAIVNYFLLNQNVTFSGAGKYRKFGNGQVNYLVDSGYSGGSLIGDGEVQVAANVKKPFGTGLTVLRANAAKSAPTLVLPSWGVDISSDIRFEGALTSNPNIKLGNPGAVSGAITSDSDIYILSNWGNFTCNTISAPGKTVKLYENLEKSGSEDKGFTSVFKGAVDASINKVGAGRLRLEGVSPTETNSLLVSAGSLILKDTAQWGGTNVTVSSGATLQLNAAENLSSASVLNVAVGGLIDVASGVKVRVGGLIVGGKPLPKGRYRAGSLPSVITGAGSIVVGVSGLMLIVR